MAKPTGADAAYVAGVRLKNVTDVILALEQVATMEPARSKVAALKQRVYIYGQSVGTPLWSKMFKMLISGGTYAIGIGLKKLILGHRSEAELYGDELLNAVLKFEAEAQQLCVEVQAKVGPVPACKPLPAPKPLPKEKSLISSVGGLLILGGVLYFGGKLLYNYLSKPRYVPQYARTRRS